LILLLPATVQGATLHVYPDGSGLFPHIQAALDAAAVGDTVLLEPGTYRGEGNHGLNFNGKDLVLKGNGNREEVVIDAEYADVGVRFQNGETASSHLSDFTITHGENNRTGTGGGITVENASPTLSNLRIVDNTGSHDAGLLLYYSDSAVSNVLFIGNDSWGDGGAIGFYWSSPYVEDCQFIGNSVGYQGGALCCGPESGGEFIDCLFQDSFASQEGGAVSINTGSTTRFENCRFIGNQAQSGGAVYCGQAGPRFTDCLFYDNTAQLYGGAFHFDYPPVDSLPVIQSTLIYDNLGYYGAGGILGTYGADVILRQVTLVGNHGDDTGGAGVSAGTSARITIEESIVAFQDGPGLMRDGSGSIEVSCSDVFGNTGGDYAGAMEDQTGISGNISEDPRFCDYGSWTLTLAEQSPCLPGNNDCGVLMGALGEDCTLTGVVEVPTSLLRFSAWPNPFNPVTTISLELPTAAEILLAIHDVTGRRIKILHEGWLDADRRDFVWHGLDDEGRQVPSGVYFVVLDGPAGRSSRKITLLR